MANSECFRWQESIDAVWVFSEPVLHRRTFEASQGASFNSLSLPCLNGLFASGLFIAFAKGNRRSTNSAVVQIIVSFFGDVILVPIQHCLALPCATWQPPALRAGKAASLCGAATSGFRTTTKARRSGRDCSSAQLARGNLMLGKAWRYLFFQFLSCASCSVSVRPFLLPSWTEERKKPHKDSARQSRGIFNIPPRR